jgi:hypothetical protein
VIGKAIAARVRLSAGPARAAFIADGNHARSDAIVSAGVILSSSRQHVSPSRRSAGLRVKLPSAQVYT